MKQSEIYRQNAENCAYLAEGAANEPTRQRYKRMEAPVLARDGRFAVAKVKSETTVMRAYTPAATTAGAGSRRHHEPARPRMRIETISVMRPQALRPAR